MLIAGAGIAFLAIQRPSGTSRDQREGGVNTRSTCLLDLAPGSGNCLSRREFVSTSGHQAVQALGFLEKWKTDRVVMGWRVCGSGLVRSRCDGSGTSRLPKAVSAAVRQRAHPRA
jgi:hypothetical protein